MDLHGQSQDNTPSEQRALGLAVARLAPLCRVPAEVAEQFILEFSHEEFEAINELIEGSGVETLIDEYGEERRSRYASVEEILAEQFDESGAPIETENDFPEDVCFLQIMCFDQPVEADPAQQAYYRAASINLEEAQEFELLGLLEDSGIAALAVKTLRTERDTPIEGREVLSLNAGVQWYGDSNIYGQGAELQISLELHRMFADNIFVSLQVNESGRVLAKLYFPEYFETGYEGHGQTELALSPEQFGQLSRLATRLAEIGSDEPAPSNIASWLML